MDRAPSQPLAAKSFTHLLLAISRPHVRRLLRDEGTSLTGIKEEQLRDLTRPPGEPRWNLPRMLFIAGVVVAIVAIVSWVTVDTNGGGGDNARGCHVPAHAKAGTQTLPPLIATLATPLGAPDASFTEDSGGVTVYGYCFDVVDGSTVASTVDQLRQLNYDASPGQNPTEQLNFTAKDENPAAVSVSVGGDLDVSHPVAGTKGALSIVWTDSDVNQ